MQIDYPTLPAVKYVAFDFCGTLAELLPGTSELLQGFVRDTYGLEVSAPAVQDALRNTSLELPYSSVKINSRELRTSYYYEFNARLLDYLGCTPALPDELYDHFSAHKRHWTIKPGGRELLDELRRRGYELVVASNHHPALFNDRLTARQLNWFSEPTAPHTCEARIRYRQKSQTCTIESIENGVVSVAFKEPQRAITPGQSIVFYDEDHVLGGGIID